MSYEPKTWVTGEVITADDLNQITPFVEPITYVDNAQTTTHNAGVIVDALDSGRIIYLFMSDGVDYSASYLPVLGYTKDDRANRYILTVTTGTTLKNFVATNRDSQFVEDNNVF